ncbi:hypothetical protein K5549_007954 [Capra hircus]|nr:hypothetical protein K5549_007954 [Capra hircus]
MVAEADRKWDEKMNVTREETTELGSKKELKSMPFITYLSGLLTAQMLSDDQLISGVEIRCEEKGRCPSTCHLCRRPGKEQLSPTPVLLEINRVVPLYTLIQDNGTKEVVLNHFASTQSAGDMAFKSRIRILYKRDGWLTQKAFRSALMSSYWCSGKGDVIDDWCRCDLSAFDASGLPNCSPLPQPVLRLSPTVEPSSTVVSLEWVDVQPAIGTKVSDYILQHKKVDEYTDTDLYTATVLRDVFCFGEGEQERNVCLFSLEYQLLQSGVTLIFFMTLPQCL